MMTNIQWEAAVTLCTGKRRHHVCETPSSLEPPYFTLGVDGKYSEPAESLNGPLKCSAVKDRSCKTYS